MQDEIDKKFEILDEIQPKNKLPESKNFIEYCKEENNLESRVLFDIKQSAKNSGVEFFNKQTEEEFVIKNEFHEETKYNNLIQYEIKELEGSSLNEWSQCKYTSPKDSRLKEHINQNQIFTCKFCQTSLSTKRCLKQHINENHFERQRQIEMADESSSDSQNVHSSEDTLLEISSTKNKIMQTKKRQNKPKVCSEWSDEDMFKLISYIKSTPMLWNSKDQNYRNKIERQTAWKHIAKVNFHGKFKEGEISAKWSNMRIQYRSYLSKYEKTKSEKGLHRQIKWKFYEPMDFISNGDDEQNPNTVLNLTYADEESFDPLLEQNVTNSPIPLKRRRISQSSSVTEISPSISHIATDEMKDIVHELNQQEQKHEVVNDEIKDAVHPFKKHQQKHDDEFTAFGKYIAAELRSLPDPNSARRVRFKVARFLLDCIEAENQTTNQAYVLED